MSGIMPMLAHGYARVVTTDLLRVSSQTVMYISAINVKYILGYAGTEALALLVNHASTSLNHSVLQI